MARPTHIHITGSQIDLTSPTNNIFEAVEAQPMLIAVSSIDQVFTRDESEKTGSTIYLKRDTKRVQPIHAEEQVSEIMSKIAEPFYPESYPEDA